MGNSRYRTLAVRVAETGDTNAGTQEFTPENGAFQLDVTAQSGTTPTLDVDIEEFDEASGKWLVAGSFAQITTVLGSERIVINSIGNRIRAAWVIAGGSATYSFTVGAFGKIGPKD